MLSNDCLFVQNFSVTTLIAQFRFIINVKIYVKLKVKAVIRVTFWSWGKAKLG